MKKIIAMLMAVLMLMGLCACSAEPEEEFVPARGKVEGNVYKNEAFGISFTAGEDWYYYSDEEIAAAMGIVAEEIFTDEYAESVSEIEIIYDMYCGSFETGETVNVNYENLGIIYGTVLDEKGYLEAAVAQFDSQMEGSGITFPKKEIGTVLIDGKEVPCLHVVMEYYGISIYETIAVKKCGDWMGVVTVASLDEAALENLVSGLSFS